MGVLWAEKGGFRRGARVRRLERGRRLLLLGWQVSGLRLFGRVRDAALKVCWEVERR